MTHKGIFDETFPQYTQVGGNHYTKFNIQPYEFISKNDLSFFLILTGSNVLSS